MTSSIYNKLAPALMALVVLLGAANWYRAPEVGAAWALGMFFLPAAWILLYMLKQIGRPENEASGAALQIYSAMTAAGLLLAVSMGLVLAEQLWGLGDHVRDRVMGVAMGGVLMVMGNYVPKRLTPITESRCDPVRAQALQRFVGWSFVLGGIVYVLAWLVLPIGVAGTVAMSACALSVIVVALRVFWTLGRRHDV
jgi:hypothetical protein